MATKATSPTAVPTKATAPSSSAAAALTSPMASVPMADRPKISHYIIGETIGSGTFGKVIENVNLRKFKKMPLKLINVSNVYSKKMF